MKKNQKKLHKFYAVLWVNASKNWHSPNFTPPKPPIQPFGPSTGRWVAICLGATSLPYQIKKPPKLSLRGLSATTNVRITLGTRPHAPEIFWTHHIFNFTTNGVHVCHTHFSVVGLFIHDNNIMSRKKWCPTKLFFVGHILQDFYVNYLTCAQAFLLSAFWAVVSGT